MIPKIVTTTQVQRNPKLLEAKTQNAYTLITKNGEPISALVSLDLLNDIESKNSHIKEAKLPKKFPKWIKDSFKDLDPLEYQKNIRDEN